MTLKGGPQLLYGALRHIMIKLTSKEDIRTAILRRGNEIAASMTDKDIFLSPQFKNYATSLADYLLRNHRLYSLDIQYDESPNAPIGYTDGKMIFLNTGNPIAAKPSLLERRFKTNLGILFHEVAHKLFVDFKFSNKSLNGIQNKGLLYGSFPVEKPFDDYHKELEQALCSPSYRNAIASIFGNVANILDDGHDEAAMKRCFPGFIRNCIEVAGESQLAASPSLNELVDKGMDPFSIYCSLILQYAKFGTYKVDDNTPFVDAYLTEMATIESVIDAALDEDDYKARWDYVNTLVLFLWPSVRNHFPDNPPQSSSDSASNSGTPNSSANGGAQGNTPGNSSGSQGGSGNSQGSNAGGNNQAQPGSDAGSGSSQEGQSSGSDQLQQLMEALAQAAMDAMNAAPAPANCNDSAVQVSDVASSPAPSGAGGLGQLLKDLTEKKAIESVQKDLDRAQMEKIRNANIPLIHQDVPVKLNRHIRQDKFTYDSIAKETAPLARNLVKQMLELFRELNEEGMAVHKPFGPIIQATESYRPDGKFFAKRKLPSEYPDMAVCFLIDLSGSMGSGSKIYFAQRTAILMEQFAAGIGVPIMITGHRTSGSDCKLEIFTDFVSAKADEDRFSLGSITSGGANRDGLALRLCCEMLAQRPEQVKLLISTSDGAPSHTGYRGKEAREDISNVCREFRRKGLTIYGAAIDEDEDIIKEIYGQGFLSIQDINSLPKKLVRLLRQNIFSK